MSEVNLEDAPFHELKRLCKEKYPDVRLKNTYKKTDLLTILKTGGSPEPPKEVKRAPRMKPKEAKIVPLLPEEIMPELERLQTKGLHWDIDEADACVNFELRTGRQERLKDGGAREIVLTACANLDQSARNILSTAYSVFPQSAPIEMSRGDTHPQFG